MKILFYLITAILIQLFSISYAEEELKENKSYRARVNLTVCEGSNVSKDATASECSKECEKSVGAQSKFVVIDKNVNGKYAIKFLDVYPEKNYYKEFLDTLPGKVYKFQKKQFYKELSVWDVTEDRIYYLDKKVNDVPVEKQVEQSFGGLVSGPLLVPFKYRLDDKSVERIMGDPTVGYYAGWGWDTNFWGASEEHVTFAPFLSAGLTQVSVSKTDEEGDVSDNSESGFSWAAGLLINNWDSVNIGIIYGQDRIGDDKKWEHEGKGWLSISFGLEL